MKVYWMAKYKIDRSKIKPLGECSKTKTFNGKRPSKKDPYVEWVVMDALSNFCDGEMVDQADVDEALQRSEVELNLMRLVDKGLMRFSFNVEDGDFIFWSVDEDASV